MANVRSTVLITGPTGAGKELIAKAIHYNSARAGRPFIRVNCSAIPDSMLEAELFGIEKHVATGVDARIGKFEAADTGTIFLDEIGDMTPPTQAKVLRAMQEREIERVGSHTPRKIDIRINAATNRDLAKAMEEGTFRRDLFHRLNVIVIPLPPLADRREDIPELIEHFIEKHCDENGLKPKTIQPGDAEKLKNMPWPGNVRELGNVIERAVVLSDSDTLKIDVIPQETAQAPTADIDVERGPVDDLEEAVKSYERKLILEALDRNDWRQNRAAAELGISERSMWYKIKKLDIDSRKSRDD